MASRQHPVQTLRDQATVLEAALTLVLARPTRKAVHRVRVSTRRIEAQLELLAALHPKTPDLAAVLQNKPRKLRKLLNIIRKAAGSVRDLDVQRDMIKQAGTTKSAKPVQDEAKTLRRLLKTRRDKQADALLDELEGHTRKLGLRLEDLLEELEPFADQAFSAKQLSRTIQAWYAAHYPTNDSMPDTLHGIRKSAKLARYMAESIGDQRLAASFEDLQQSGGAWHDALSLSHVARRHLGKKAALVESFRLEEKSTLAAYRKRLRSQSAQSPGC